MATNYHTFVEYVVFLFGSTGGETSRAIFFAFGYYNSESFNVCQDSICDHIDHGDDLAIGYLANLGPNLID